MTPVELQRDDALIIVDVQRDFCPGGALAVRDCGGMFHVLNDWIAAACRAGCRIVASRDWHPADHCSFHEQGGPWPAHCVQESDGARFHPELALPENVTIVSKGMERDVDSYSAFGGTGLDEWLRQQEIRRVWIGGLVQEICVRATALDAVRTRLETAVLRHGTCPIDEEGGRRAFEEMRLAGIRIIA